MPPRSRSARAPGHDPLADDDIDYGGESASASTSANANADARDTAGVSSLELQDRRRKERPAWNEGKAKVYGDVT